MKLPFPPLAISGLKTESRYLRLIDKLFEKYKNRRRESQEDELGLNVFIVHQERSKIAYFLSQLLGSGQYQLGVPQSRKVKIGKKVRDISSYHLVDTLAQSALYEWLMEEAEKFVSPSVYSYLKGRSGRQAINGFLDYVRQHRNAQGHVDLFVFRADLASYTDTIPVGQNSLLWNYITTLLHSKRLSADENHYIMQLIESALRPVKTTRTGEPYQQTIGIPTGSSLTTVAGLLYLTELDHALTGIDGGFYARYGDDILFAHHDWQAFKQGEAHIDSIVERLRLKRNLKKEQRIYYTKAGRRHHHYPGLTGSQQVNYLGYLIFAEGSLGLPSAKLQIFLQQLRVRALRCVRLLNHLSPDEQGHALCQAINRMLNPNHPMHEPRVARILSQVSSRACLKELDYSIALMVAELMSGIHGVKAWRVIPYRMVRQRWRLRSLCQRRNQKRTITHGAVITD